MLSIVHTRINEIIKVRTVVDEQSEYYHQKEKRRFGILLKKEGPVDSWNDKCETLNLDHFELRDDGWYYYKPHIVLYFKDKTTITVWFKTVDELDDYLVKLKVLDPSLFNVWFKID